ncbi:MAG: AAA family ATPase [Cytophagales bacterium]
MRSPIKIVLFGPESTGKSVLSEQLAKHFGTIWVAEYARNYLESKKKYYDFYSKGSEAICLQEDILPIVLGQIAFEDLQIQSAKKYIFFDTNPLQTKVYVNYYYKTEYTWLLKILEERSYNLYLLTDIDIEWQPDLLRDRPENRVELFNLFEKELKTRQLPYETISGSDTERLKNAIVKIEHWVEKNK